MKMDSNFIQMSSLSADNEEQSNSARRRTAVTTLEMSTPHKNKRMELDRDDTYRSIGDDSNFQHPTPNENNNGKRRIRLREQLHYFRIMAAPYFRENKEGRCLFAIMVLLSLANTAVRVAFSYLSRDFWSALSDKEEDKFYDIMTLFLAACVALAPISAGYRYQRQKLAIAWRKWLTGRVMDLYFANKVYYSLERQLAGGVKSPDSDDAAGLGKENKEVDNPDQRISEDIRSFTEFSLTFFLTLVTSFIDLVCFSFILFSIMPQLFLAIFGFATFGTIITICVGKVLIRLNYEALAKEADFRFSLVRVREHAESIAFYTGEDVEERETCRRFHHVIANMTQINLAQLKLDLCTTMYNYITWILPIMVIAPQYFLGNVELGVISQASSAFGHILDDLSIVINSFTDVSKFSAGIDRLYSFMSAIQVLDPERDIGALLLSTPPSETALLGGYSSQRRSSNPITAETISVKVFDLSSSTFYSSAQPQAKPVILSIKGLKLITPDKSRVLVQNLNLSLTQGKNLLITGASGAGKSSLLRAVAGLWNTGCGEIVRPGYEHVFFLPQRPYCPPGSLRDQLLYPSSTPMATFSSTQIGIDDDDPSVRRRLSRDWSDQELLQVLDSVDLPNLASRSGGLDAVLDWSNTLSLGEQQRLAFGRLVVNRPRLIVMDESSSALDVFAEKKMFHVLKDLARDMRGSGGLTWISVGHRPTLLAHHDLKLSLPSGVCSVIPPNAGAIDEGLIMD